MIATNAGAKNGCHHSNTAASQPAAAAATRAQLRGPIESRSGVAGQQNPGVLEDYADVAEGALTLYAVTGQTR